MLPLKSAIGEQDRSEGALNSNTQIDNKIMVPYDLNSPFVRKNSFTQY